MLGPRLRCLLIAAGGGELQLPGSRPAASMSVSPAGNKKKKPTALLVPCLCPAALQGTLCSFRSEPHPLLPGYPQHGQLWRCCKAFGVTLAVPKHLQLRGEDEHKVRQDLGQARADLAPPGSKGVGKGENPKTTQRNPNLCSQHPYGNPQVL